MGFWSAMGSDIISIVSIALTGFVGWFFGRRKTKAETRGVEIENDIKLSKHYQRLLDDLEGRYKEKFDDVSKLYDKKEKALKEEIRILKRRIRVLKAENRDLRKENSVLEKKIKEIE